MSQADLIEPALSEQEAEMAKVASRCLMAALDHSRAQKIVLTDETGKVNRDDPVLELPPQALRFFAQVLSLMSKRQVISLIPQKHEFSTQEAAGFLNVSRPFLIKQLETGKLEYKLVGTHRRISFEALVAFKNSMQRKSREAMQALADLDQDMGLE